MRKLVITLSAFAALAALSSPAAAGRFTDSESVPPEVTETDLAPSVAGAVPEPASWALMISGFAFVGLALRRQRGTRRTA